MLSTFLQSFSFMLLRASDFLIFFRKFILSFAMATNQIQQFEQNSYVW